MTDEELIKSYPEILRELKKRKIITTDNLVGELGEYRAIESYNKDPNLPNLAKAPKTTKNIDAISRDGDRYSIKSTRTGLGTGQFWGLEPPDSERKDTQKFEYVIIVVFDRELNIKNIFEITWEQFLQVKRPDKRTGHWKVPLNQKVREIAKKIV